MIFQAGDKSLANVIAHEIAHSWTGNLVTNKNWVDATPAWMTRFNRDRAIDQWFGEAWTRSGPAAAYEGLVESDVRVISGLSARHARDAEASLPDLARTLGRRSS